jgi:hypothetical protein
MRSSFARLAPFATVAALLLSAASALEGRQKKEPAPADRPRIVVASPLGATVGVPSKLTLRGLKLDAVVEARCQEPKASIILLGKGKKSAPPDKQDVNKVGDGELDVELTLPADCAASYVTITVIGPGGESAPYRLLADRRAALAEKEPNNGFRQAHAVEPTQEINGVISQALDVDVFRFEARAGQKLVAEVFAARHGSALDSLLTLYNADGQSLAVSDDLADTTDSRIETTLPKSGTYYLSVMDAHDQGGPAHVYRLSIRSK